MGRALQCVHCGSSSILSASFRLCLVADKYNSGGFAGTVVTLLPLEQRPQLQAIAEELRIHIDSQPAPQAEELAAEADPEARRRALDDLFNLY